MFGVWREDDAFYEHVPVQYGANRLVLFALDCMDNFFFSWVVAEAFFEWWHDDHLGL